MSKQRRAPFGTVRIAARSDQQPGTLSQESDQPMLVEFMVFSTSLFVLSMQIPLFPRDPNVKIRAVGELFLPLLQHKSYMIMLKLTYKHTAVFTYGYFCFCFACFVFFCFSYIILPNLFSNTHPIICRYYIVLYDPSVTPPPHLLLCISVCYLSVKGYVILYSNASSWDL